MSQTPLIKTIYYDVAISIPVKISDEEPVPLPATVSNVLVVLPVFVTEVPHIAVEASGPPTAEPPI